uniref:Eukaryotic translation initiation factor 3 subunit A n=1 Tax=Timema douglasi TaxID=61478 RepID=A0A7R8VD43_TIMDO|nr:unnamed protein product [Timema douglasi]
MYTLVKDLISLFYYVYFIFQVQDRKFWEQQESERIQLLLEERELAVQHRERLARMKVDKDAFLEKLKSERKTVYQSEEPLIHVLHEHWCLLLKTLLGRFVKPEVIKDKSIDELKLMFPCIEKEQSDDDFEIGVETRKTLKKLNLKEKLKEFEAHLEEERKKRLAERKEQRKKDRQAKWIQEREQEEQRKKDEEERQKQEEERKRKEEEERAENLRKQQEDDEYKRKKELLDKQAELQRQRELDAERKVKEREKQLREQSSSWRSRGGAVPPPPAPLREKESDIIDEPSSLPPTEKSSQWRRGGNTGKEDGPQPPPIRKQEAWRPIARGRERDSDVKSDSTSWRRAGEPDRERERPSFERDRERGSSDKERDRPSFDRERDRGFGDRDRGFDRERGSFDRERGFDRERPPVERGGGVRGPYTVLLVHKKFYSRLQSHRGVDERRGVGPPSRGSLGTASLRRPPPLDDKRGGEVRAPKEEPKSQSTEPQISEGPVEDSSWHTVSRR